LSAREGNPSEIVALRSAAVEAEVDPVARVDVVREGVLVHVDDHVHPQRPSPIDYLRQAIDQRLAERAPRWLEDAPGDGHAHGVEAEPRHRLKV